MKSLVGYRSYFFGWLLIAVGVFMLLFIDAEKHAAYVTGQDIIKNLLAIYFIIQGFTVVFIRLAIQGVKDEIRRMHNE